jgi:formate-dependent nitrite reductase membrane component NrfD
MVTDPTLREPAPKTPSIDVLTRATPEAVRNQGYSSIPFLKRPLWRWEIALYFGCEGISAGAYLISTMAELFGGGRYHRLVQAARYLSFIFILPAPPLLIADLGRPERFHHMLRVIKPISPMNVGSWALTTYSIPVALLAAQQAAEDGLPLSSKAPRFLRRLPTKTLSLAGLPSAMTMISYPGVLLSMTSTPVWTSSRLLGALISLSSISMGAAAISLVLGLSRDYGPLQAMRRIEKIASVCESGVLAGYVATSGFAARPLVSGRYAKQFWLGAVACGLLLPAIMHAREKEKGSRGILRSLLTLAGGFALKWALTHVGRTSALDPEANRYGSRPTESAPGWSPEQSRARRRTEERAA